MSIFSTTDQSKNMCFWNEVDGSLQNGQSNVIHSGKLLELTISNQLTEKFFKLTKNSLLRSKNENATPTKISNLKWKLIEPFIEEGENGMKYGFRVTHGIACRYFYTTSSEELDLWLEHLAHVGIMTEINDDYELKQKIGSGSFANVFLATSHEDGKEYAVKSISKTIIQKSKNLAALINEIDILRSVDHPNITKLHKIYETNSHIHLVLDYVSGGDLLHRILKRGQFSEKDAAKFTTKMLKVLNYLSSNNIVHRDIKLENILMVNESGTNFKLTDFGLSCTFETELTQNCGSPGYVAPEILKRLPYGPKVDIFSLGVVLYILLSGRAPFNGKNPKETLIKNRDCMLVFDDRYWSGISKEAVNMILSLACSQPKLRHSAKEALKNKWLSQYRKESEPLSSGLISSSWKIISPQKMQSKNITRIREKNNSVCIDGSTKQFLEVETENKRRQSQFIACIDGSTKQFLEVGTENRRKSQIIACIDGSSKQSLEVGTENRRKSQNLACDGSIRKFLEVGTENKRRMSQTKIASRNGSAVCV